MRIAWMAIVGCALLLAGAMNSQADQTKHRVGITQIVEHPALDATRQGFLDQLAEDGFAPQHNLLFDYRNAQNNRAISSQIARKFVGDDVDLILAISTPSSQDAAAATDTIPVLFSAVTDPLTAGLVKSLQSPGGNVSGTSDRSPVSKQLDLILQILPGAGKLGTIYNAGEVNSLASVKTIRQGAAKRGLEVIAATAANSSAVKMAADSLVGRVDFIHIPTDNTVVLALESVVKVCTYNKIPLFAADVESVERGAIAALAVDYYQLGRQTGSMAVKILRGRAAVSDLPVEFQEELLLHLNPGQAEAMGVVLPKSLIDRAEKIVR